MTSNTYENKELKAMDLIQNSLDIEMPLNQQGMPGYYHEKNYYLKEAIKALESQIQLYEQQSTSWSHALDGTFMNNAMEGGKKHKKTRKTKKSKRV